jgi:hypothetical protein
LREVRRVTGDEAQALALIPCSRSGPTRSANEATQRLLLRLLAESGKRQAALEGFERYRRRLQDELGLEPDRETLALADRVRLGEDHRGEPLADAFSPSRSPALNLPLVSTPLVGREADLESLQSRLSHPDCRLVTLIAPGGMGKTRLAIEAALHVNQEFAAGVCFVPLAGVMSP